MFMTGCFSASVGKNLRKKKLLLVNSLCKVLEYYSESHGMKLGF